jgi:hypothetical protein
MYFGYAAWLIVLGALGASNLIIARKPDAKELLAKFAPYQGWMGAASALGGVWMIISAVLALGLLSSGFSGMMLWITYMATAVVQAGLGLLLGIGTLKTFIKAPQATEKMDQLVTKLAPFQGTLGLIAMGLGVWEIVAIILFS